MKNKDFPANQKVYISAKSQDKEQSWSFDAKHLEHGRIDVFEKTLSRAIQCLYSFSNEERPKFKLSLPEGSRLTLVKDKEDE